MSDHEHPHEPAGHSHEPAREPASGLTGYAIVKYGFILIITIVILYFVANYILDRF